MFNKLNLIAFLLLLTASLPLPAAAETLQFAQTEQVKVGKSIGSNSLGSLADGSAIVLTSQASAGRIKGFSLSRVVGSRAVKLVHFEPKPLSIAAKVFYVREARLQVTPNDGMLVFYSVYTEGNDASADTGTELQVAASDKTGVYKYSKLLDRSGRSSYIDTINTKMLPDGNLLAVYNSAGNIFMSAVTPAGELLFLRQVNHDTGDGPHLLRTGHSMAVGSSGRIRIVWSDTRRSRAGVVYGVLAIATFDKSGNRKNIEYVDDNSKRPITSLSTFFLKGGTFSDVVVRYHFGRYTVRFYRQAATGERELLIKRSTGSEEAAWYGASPFKGEYAVYTHQKSNLNCYLSYASLIDGAAVGMIQITTGRLTNKCNGSTSAKMADGSIGAVVAIQGDVAHFVRFRSK